MTAMLSLLSSLLQTPALPAGPAAAAATPAVPFAAVLDDVAATPPPGASPVLHPKTGASPEKPSTPTQTDDHEGEDAPPAVPALVVPPPAVPPQLLIPSADLLPTPPPLAGPGGNKSQGGEVRPGEVRPGEVRPRVVRLDVVRSDVVRPDGSSPQLPATPSADLSPPAPPLAGPSGNKSRPEVPDVPVPGGYEPHHQAAVEATTPPVVAPAAAPAPAIPAPAPAPAPVASPSPVVVPEAPQPALSAALGRLRRGPDGVHQLEIALHPADLGSVQVRVTIAHGTLDVTVACADPAARDAVAAALPSLHRDLAGLHRVDVAPASAHDPRPDVRGDSQPQRDARESPDQQSRHHRRTPTPPDDEFDRWM